MVYKVLLSISFHSDFLHTFVIGVLNIISQIKNRCSERLTGFLKVRDLVVAEVESESRCSKSNAFTEEKQPFPNYCPPPLACPSLYLGFLNFRIYDWVHSEFLFNSEWT